MFNDQNHCHRKLRTSAAHSGFAPPWSELFASHGSTGFERDGDNRHLLKDAFEDPGNPGNGP